ncbi:hypothetical protein [Brevibacillus fulvus]|uniref:Uncharacterized protein n=1 Tax=Brevibacillus fulvus TaxID=1125967 RepID=A0A939BQK0_9BACL|nr:hypothetical protein [Brevibacillus fulvus]MBM7588602.1 hypothetical protein [Brevibacillus fulvus]
MSRRIAALCSLCFICFIAAGCQVQLKPTEQLNFTEIQRSYYEIVYNDSTFLAGIANMLNTNPMTDVSCYADGYLTALQNRRLYEEVSPVVYDQLGKELGDQLASQYIHIVSELPKLAMATGEWLAKKQVAPGSPQYRQLADEYQQLSALLWDSPVPLAEILAYPGANAKKLGRATLDQLARKILDQCEQMQRQIQSLPNKPVAESGTVSGKGAFFSAFP